MSVDQILNRREAILERLFAIGQDDLKSAGVATALRNPNPIPTDPRNGILGVPRPVFALFDGDTRLMQNVEQHKIAKMPVTTWRMDPQILIILEQRDNFENTILGANESPIGQELSNWHDIIHSLVTNDPELVDLVTVNGGHHLASVQTSLKIGRDVGAYGAWLLMLYVFDYPLFTPR